MRSLDDTHAPGPRDGGRRRRRCAIAATQSRGSSGGDLWALFDLDDTLLDYTAAERTAVLATLADAGLPASEALVAAYRSINARHWRRLEQGRTTPGRLRVDRWHELLAEHGAHGHVDPQLLAERYLHHLAAGSQLVDGAVEVVHRVARTRRVAFISNGLADVQRPRLEASALADASEVLVISDEVGAAKPDPAIFDAAFARMGDPAREAVTLIGDSLTSDIAGGVAYGIETVWVAAPEAADPEAGSPPPTHRIGRLRDLPPLLGA